MTVRDDDKGWRALVKGVNAFDGRALEAGIVEDADAHIAPRAAALEFGTHEIPEYAFFRKGWDANLSDISASASDAVQEVMDGKGSAINRVRTKGPALRDHLRRSVVDIKTPPNDPETVDDKGGNNPGIDTGAFLKAIKWRVPPRRKGDA